MEWTIVLNNGFLENPPDVLKFLGRFHPMVVHLPIGFLLMAGISQLATRWPKFYTLKPYTPYLWALGAWSAFFSVVFGYLLSLSGDYDTDTLFWHQWSGIALLALSTGCYLLFKSQFRLSAYITWVPVVLVVVLLMYTGHLGGNLTHGSTYLLEYAPNTLRNVAGLPPKKEPRKKVAVIDSADIFLDLVVPIMERKCVSCHNEGKRKGDLLLTSHNHILAGGESNETVLPGNPEGSELFRRITLPETHDDFMPSEGKPPLSDEEVEIIGFWIQAGALPNGYVTELPANDAILPTVIHYLGLDRNTVFNKIPPVPNAADIDSLQNKGFLMNRLMEDKHFYEANFSLSGRSFKPSDAQMLIALKEQLVWLNLANAAVKDVHLEKIGQLENLVRLDLRGNPITDVGIAHLLTLKNLESLNLFGTQVSDGVFELLPQFPKLKTVYLWQTPTNDSLALQFQKAHKNITIVYEREGF
ncbi:c-type cytochrome domain-containing protein [Pareuzebyella sediminis]|uniref:c-type cytochrome domain-containing protein n=1 Tax=Pareuzebyella sediminis TaxID=2607998 RepID=UPI0011EDA49F|nr:c-type cytochrome domain-containing protein [Pareuzebyella sediminis]